jgi:hypothetical protein
MVPERPKQLTIRDERNGDIYSFCCVRIDDSGSLVLEVVDGGPEVERMFGDSDVEAFVRVMPEDKDALLLHLVKAQFSSADAFRKWLAERGIESGFHVH